MTALPQLSVQDLLTLQILDLAGGRERPVTLGEIRAELAGEWSRLGMLYLGSRVVDAKLAGWAVVGADEAGKGELALVLAPFGAWVRDQLEQQDA